jgi:hypothetical protein
VSVSARPPAWPELALVVPPPPELARALVPEAGLPLPALEQALVPEQVRAVGLPLPELGRAQERAVELPSLELAPVQRSPEPALPRVSPWPSLPVSWPPSPE